jgi:sarcosine oxidase subunit alpha
MGLARGRIEGVPALVLAASYSGERAFEIYVTSDQAAVVWSALQGAAEAEGGGLYGLEALEILRIEKGHVETGGEIDGRTSAHDLRLEKMLNPRGGFIGHAGMQRPFFSDPDRVQLVGLESLGGPIPEGSMLVERPGAAAQGHVTGSGVRTKEEGFIALGLLKGGRQRDGEILTAWSGVRGKAAAVRVVSPHFYDPQGARYRD